MAEPVRARRLTDQEGQRLLQIVRRGKHESARVRRAMIIMTSASGTLVPAIARLVAADEDTARDVIHAFNAKGLAALDPQWAGGRPRRISASLSVGGCGSSASGRWPGRGSAAVTVRVTLRAAIVRLWATTGASALRWMRMTRRNCRSPASRRLSLHCAAASAIR
jgi:hypothetical protein